MPGRALNGSLGGSEKKMMKKITNPHVFITELKRYPGSIYRGAVIDYLGDNKERWANVIRALVLGNSDRTIERVYLIEKVRFCENNPDKPEAFLDYKRMQIFKALEME